jgi:hypothetical protein
MKGLLKIVKPILLLLIFNLYISKSYSQQVDSNSNFKKDTTFYPNRFAVVIGSSSIGLIGSYIYVQNAWWSDQKTAFHIDHNMDYRYAMNLDKGAHFIGGIMFAEAFKAGFYWSGISKEKSYFYAFLMGGLLQGLIEIKDGYAPSYGFSVGDVSAGVVGSFIPYIKYRFPRLHALNIKISYYRHDDFYFKMFPHADIIDDYMNQTYWLALTVNDWLPKGSKIEKLWPDFLCIVGGWGVDNTLDMYYTGVNLDENKGKGNYEFYISLDIDWRKIIRQNTHFKKALASSLNYVKLPLPTLRISPTMKYYWGFL